MIRLIVACLRAEFDSGQIYVVAKCEIKLFGDNFEIISVFYFTCNHWRWLHDGNSEIVSK